MAAAAATSTLLTTSSTGGSKSSHLASQFANSSQISLLRTQGAFPSRSYNLCQATSLKETVGCRAQASGAVLDESATKVHKTLYSLLGIEQNVSLPEIKSAYRQMALKYHPDVCPPAKREESTRMFLQVQEAYDRLSDPERRAEYDYDLTKMSFRTSGSGISWGFVDRSTRTRRSDSFNEAWRTEWLRQLEFLEEMKAMDQFSESWGARMRRYNSDSSEN